MYSNPNNKKTTSALIVSLFAALYGIFLVPSSVFAAETNLPPPAAETTEAEQPLSMEYRYAQGEDAVIPEIISQFGRDYRLTGTSDPVAEGALPETRTYTYRVSGLITAAELADAHGLGDVKLTPVMGSRVSQVERDEVLTGLPTNDIEDLPPYKRYEESSATSPGATVSGELKLAEASFAVAGHDEYGLPNRYTATTVYRGSETTSYTAYYAAEATYRRSVQEAAGGQTFVVTASYAPVEAWEVEEPVPLQEPAPIEEPGASEGAGTEIVLADAAKSPTPLAAFVDTLTTTEKIGLLAGIAIFIAAVLLFFLLLRGRRETPRGPQRRTALPA
jgi:hypothetical protein